MNVFIMTASFCHFVSFSLKTKSFGDQWWWWSCGCVLQSL